MLLSQDQDQIRAALAIQKKCSLKQVVLSSCTLVRHGDEDKFTSPFRLNFSHHCDAKLREGLLTVTAVFQFRCADASHEPQGIFEIDCSFDLDYELPPEFRPSEAEVDAFKNGNAIFNCWPYVREYVQSTSARMGFNPPPLALLRITPVAKPPERAEPATPKIESRAKPSKKKNA